MTDDKLMKMLDEMDAMAQGAAAGARVVVFEEMGGYDCMTSSFDIVLDGRRIAAVDLRQYGQKSNLPAEDSVLLAAKANATLAAIDPALVRALVAVARDFVEIHESQSCPYCEHGLEGTHCQEGLAWLRRIAEARHGG